MPQLTIWRQFLDCSAEKKSQIEPGGLTELRREKSEFTKFKPGGITEQNAEVGETSQRELWISTEQSSPVFGLRMQDQKLLENRESSRPNDC